MKRGRAKLSGLALALSSCVLATSSGPALAASDGVIDVSGKGKVRSFGGFEPRQDPSPTAAGAVFGPGIVLEQSENLCKVSWPAVSLVIDFVNLGAPGVSACDPVAGRAQRLTASGPGWVTNRGLAIGDRARKMKKLYREDKLRKGKFELIDQRSLIGVSGRQTVLSAFVANGTVTGLQVWAGAAGD